MIDAQILQYIVPPVLGGVIGYITNDLAIRMLFRPHEAKYIFGVHIPFTPGIIPKEKGRIASSIGNVVSENLLDQKTLGTYLLSDEMTGKLRTSVEKLIASQKVNEETVETMLYRFLSEDELHSVKNSVNGSLTEQISTKLTDPAVGAKVAALAMDHVAGRLSGEGANEIMHNTHGLLNGLAGGAAALFGGNLVREILGMLREPIERYLANNINEILRGNGRQIVSSMVDNEADVLLGKRVCDLLKGHDDLLDKIPAKAESIYRTIITDHLHKLLVSVDISKIVTDRINGMDVAETEQLIFQIMAKELKAIVWLGAGLGLIMGCVNLLLP